jgi:4-alpha-glucanotransferase
VSGAWEHDERPALHALSRRAGILDEYVDQSGQEVRVTSDETRIAILAAMGMPAATEEEARNSIERLTRAEAARLLAPVRVVVRGSGSGLGIGRHHLGRGDLEIELRLESGSAERGTWPMEAQRSDAPEFDVSTLPFGYHSLRVTSADGIRDEQTLIVVPDSCVVPNARYAGLTVQLYTVRSARNWGIGDMTDLGELLAFAGERGMAFVGVSPLHALRNRGYDISPYAPLSRLFRNPVFIDPDDIPEIAETELAGLPYTPAVRAELERLRATDSVEYDAVMDLKDRTLRTIHRTLRETSAREGSTWRDAYQEFLAEQGDALVDFATHQALSDHFTPEGSSPPSWHDWPESYRDPRRAEVARFREEHELEVDYHCWAQFILDRQLRAAAQRGADAGTTIGVYQDLAVGSAAHGSDPWAFGYLFAHGVALGAPPDDYARQGQNWGLPPLNPRALAEDRYRYWISLVRSGLRHAGALRIDHVLGLFRQFWIPAGMDGQHGAYVRFPTQDLLGVLALESMRHQAVIVGEDLGTIPPEVPSTLRQRGVLASRVMFFEREWDGRFKPSSMYEPLALATADTHDMATLSGFWRGRDIELRRQVGLLTTDEEAWHAWMSRDADRGHLLRLLQQEGVLTTVDPPPSDDELRGAIHAFICRTPSLLVGLSLDDLAGEVEPVNIPGVGVDRYPSWSRRLKMPLEELRVSAAVQTALRCGRLAGS